VHSFRTLTIEELLGRDLNSVEKKYAPRTVYVSGRLGIPLRGLRVSVVGTREPKHVERAVEVVLALVKKGIVVVSGLARGIDTAAHRTAIEQGGKTIAVLGTPLDMHYPPENKELQNLIMREHLAISQFPSGAPVTKKNFPMRNRTMALISQATVIVEAGENSGVISQAWECLRLGRLLLLHESLAGLQQFKEILKYNAYTFQTVDEILEMVEEYCPVDDDTIFEKFPVEL
jgi:DNA processing protein